MASDTEWRAAMSVTESCMFALASLIPDQNRMRGVVISLSDAP